MLLCQLGFAILTKAGPYSPAAYLANSFSCAVVLWALIAAIDWLRNRLKVANQVYSLVFD